MKKRIICFLTAILMLTEAFGISGYAAVYEPEISIGSYSGTVLSASSPETQDLTQYVDMSYGTDEISLTTIGPTRPNASVNPGPTTAEKSYSTGYIPSEPIRGFSQIHMSAGAPRYANFLLSPQRGLSTAIDSHDSAKSNEAPTASEYSVTLADYDIDVSLTPTEHSVIYKINYKQNEETEAGLLLEMLHAYAAEASSDINISITRADDGGVAIYGGQKNGQNPNLWIYFYAVVGKSFDSLTDWGTYIGSEKTSGKTSGSTVESKHLDSGSGNVQNGMGAYLTFDTPSDEDEEIFVKIAISFRGPSYAKSYLSSEIPEWDYDGIKAETESLWNEKLSTVTISENSTDNQKRLFYTMLYKSFINPRRRDAYDYTADGTEENARFETAGVNDVIIDDQLCTWDTFRTLYPLYTLIDTKLVEDTVNSYVLRLDNNGCVRDMVLGGVERDRNQGGDDTDNVIAEAYLKLSGSSTVNVDWEEAYRCLKDNAENWRDDQNDWGWPVGGVASTYRSSLGYIPADENYYENKSDGRNTTSTWVMSCNKTLEYSYNDYCVAMVAYSLSQNTDIDEEKRNEYYSDYEKYLARSGNWENLWNSELHDEVSGFTGFIWPRYSEKKNYEWVDASNYHNTKGKFTSPTSFNGSWVDPFYEATCYSYSFLIPHDISTLITKMGGEKKFIERLMWGIDNSAISIDNQPGFIQAFYFNETSEPWHTSDYVATNLRKFANRIPGCEDSGSLCAWYIFSTIGFFPNAGQSYYWLTSPKYESATFKLDGGKTFTVNATNLSDENKYIQAVYLNGNPYYGTRIEHSDIASGGTLEFVMGNKPVDYSVEPVDTGVLTSGHTWTYSSDNSLTISGTGEIMHSSVLPWLVSEKFGKSDIEKVIIESGSTAVGSAGMFSDLKNLTEIIIPQSLTDLSAGKIFANDPKLTKITTEDNKNEEINLIRITSVSDDLFENSSVGLGITLKLGNAEFAPKRWFDDTTNVNLIVTAGTSADEWQTALKGGTDTRDVGYRFTVKTVARISEGVQYDANGVARYGWSLDSDTGILTFTNLKSGWNELSFNDYTDFKNWIKDWKDDIKHIVIPSFGKLTTNRTTSPFLNLPNLESVKIDTARWFVGDNSIFAGCPKLKTIGNSSDFEEGKVKLNGFGIERNSTGELTGFFDGCSSIEYVDFTNFTISPDDGVTKTDLKIGENTLRDCTSLKTVILSGVKSIGTNSFGGCTSLETITIPESVISVADDAFAGCTALSSVIIEATELPDGFVTVKSFPDQAGLAIICQNRETAKEINSLGYTLTRAINKYASVASGITMEGFSIRYSDYNGLRGIFSFDKSVEKELEQDGITLVEYGGIVASKESKNKYGMELSKSGNEFVSANDKIVKKAVYKNGVFVDSILNSPSDEKTEFAISIVKYEKFYDADICMAAYSIWKDPAGNYSVKYEFCENADYVETSLYKVTLGMYKDGFINASNDPDGVIWNVLESCAATLTAGTDYRDGDRDLDGNAFGTEMLFKNVPIFQTIQGSRANASGQVIGLGFKQWENNAISCTLLPDGDDYVAIIRGNGALPNFGNGYPALLGQFSASYNSVNTNGPTVVPLLYSDADGEAIGYIDKSGNKIALGTDSTVLEADVHRRQPSPTFTASFQRKIKTYIFDDGITNIPNLMFYGNTGVETVIYADTVKSMGERAFESATKIKTISPYGEKPTYSVLDLSGFTDGFGKVTFSLAVNSVELMVVLPKIPNFSSSDSTRGILSRGMFEKCNKISAVSTDKKSLTAGVADLRGLTGFVDGTGNGSLVSTLIKKVYLDDNVTSIGANVFNTKDTATKYTFYTEGPDVTIVKNYAGESRYKGGFTYEDALSD